MSAFGWLLIVAVLGGWIVASIPLAALVGRALRRSRELEEARWLS